MAVRTRSSIAQPDQVIMHQDGCFKATVISPGLYCVNHRSFLTFILSYKKFLIATLSVCTVGEAHVWCIQKDDHPASVQASGTLTGVSRKAYWVKRHRSRHQQFRDGTEMGFHGYALELHWIRGQEFWGVYWKREREEWEEAQWVPSDTKIVRSVTCSGGFKNKSVCKILIM